MRLRIRRRRETLTQFQDRAERRLGYRPLVFGSDGVRRYWDRKTQAWRKLRVW